MKIDSRQKQMSSVKVVKAASSRGLRSTTIAATCDTDSRNAWQGPKTGSQPITWACSWLGLSDSAVTPPAGWIPLTGRNTDRLDHRLGTAASFRLSALSGRDVNLLANWLLANSDRAIVVPDWYWLIAYEFEGQHLLIRAWDESSADPTQLDRAAALAAQFADRLEARTCDVGFRVENRIVEFSVGGGAHSATSLATHLQSVFGTNILKGGGAAKPVNVSGQVTSPYQHWQRSTLSPALVAQDFDGWVDSSERWALEFKQVKRLNDWRPYRDDAPNFRSLLSCMGTPSSLIVVAAPQGQLVEPTTPVRPFLLTYLATGKGAYHLPARTASELASAIDGDLPELSELRPLEPSEWKTWQRR